MPGEPPAKDFREEPLVFDIARGSFEDGPGIRTVVFLKGCPLRCPWCQNPESHLARRETFYSPEKCISCGLCQEGDDSQCSTLAKQIVGVYHPPSVLARLIARDRPFYENSGGGVTFSGGEPLLYPDYLYDTITAPGMEDIHVAVETCGHFDFKKLEEKLLPHIRLFLFDVKIMDAQTHAAVIGKANDLIVENFKKLLEKGAEVLPRIPLIPGIVATEENLARIARFFIQMNIKKYSLLPYNPSGLGKWLRLKKPKPDDIPEKPMSLEEERRWGLFFQMCMESGR